MQKTDGLINNGNVIIPKHVRVYESQEKVANITLQNVLPGIKSKSKDEFVETIGLSDIKIEIKNIYNESSIGDSKIYADFYTDQGEKIESVEFNKDNNNYVATKNGLHTGEYYYKLYYMENEKKVYLYDISEKQKEVLYKFEIVNNVKITNAKIRYERTSYNESKITVQHSATVTNGYDGYQYIIYKKTDNSTYEPINNTIRYSLDETNYITADEGKFTINLNDFNNSNQTFYIDAGRDTFFEFNTEYKIKIIPIVNDELVDEVDTIGEAILEKFEPKTPEYNVKAFRIEGNGDDVKDSIVFDIYIDDKDYMVVKDDKLNYQIKKGNDVIDSGDKGFNRNLIRIKYELSENDDLKSEYNITATYKYYKSNKNVEGSKQEATIENTLNKIEEETYIGDKYKISILNTNNENDSKILIRFRNSYKLSNIYCLQYSIYDEISKEFLTPENNTIIIPTEQGGVGIKDEDELYKSIEFNTGMSLNSTYSVVINLYGDSDKTQLIKSIEDDNLKANQVETEQEVRKPVRKLTEGNKSKFAIFALVIVATIIVLTLVLVRVLTYDKEVYAIEKQKAIYDVNYEYINLTEDAVIEKKWTGKYYLTEHGTNLSYELGNTAIAFDPIRNRMNLYGSFYEVASDGSVSKTNRQTEVKDMTNPKLYKIEDRKYLLIADNIQNETGTIEAEKYLIIVIDKSGNTLLLNNTMNVKTINVVTLKTDAFLFDIANEKLIYENTTIDLKKIIGSTNQYVQTEKKKENVLEEEEVNEDNQEDLTPIITTAGNANSYTSTVINQGGATSVNIGSVTQPTIQNRIVNSNNNISNGNSSNNNNNNSNNSNNNSDNNVNSNSNNNNNGTDNNSQGNSKTEDTTGSESNDTSKQNNNTTENTQVKNVTQIVKSASLRGVAPGETYIDVQYSIVDPNNEYQVVYLEVSGGGTKETISLDKSQSSYRIAGLKQNTDYSIAMGYREIKSDATVEEITEDVISVKTLKVTGSLDITKVTPKRLYFNLKLDANSSYSNAKIAVYVDDEEEKTISVVANSALRENGWQSSIEFKEDMKGKKVTLKLVGVKEIELTTSTRMP